MMIDLVEGVLEEFASRTLYQANTWDGFHLVRYRASEQDRLNAKQRRYNARNRETLAAKQSIYRVEHRAEINAYKREYRARKKAEKAA